MARCASSSSARRFGMSARDCSLCVPDAVSRGDRVGLRQHGPVHLRSRQLDGERGVLLAGGVGVAGSRLGEKLGRLQRRARAGGEHGGVAVRREPGIGGVQIRQMAAGEPDAAQPGELLAGLGELRDGVLARLDRRLALALMLGHRRRQHHRLPQAQAGGGELLACLVERRAGALA